MRGVSTGGGGCPSGAAETIEVAEEMDNSQTASVPNGIRMTGEELATSRGLGIDEFADTVNS